MNKKAIVEDATIIAISFIIIATLGAASFSMFGLNLLGGDVEQAVKEFAYRNELDETLFNFLKQDADYKGLNNLGLILLCVNNKIDFNLVENKLNENFDIEKCWFLVVVEEGNPLYLFKKTNCEVKLSDKSYEKTSLDVVDLEKKLSIGMGIKNE